MNAVRLARRERLRQRERVKFWISAGAPGWLLRCVIDESEPFTIICVATETEAQRHLRRWESVVR